MSEKKGSCRMNNCVTPVSRNIEANNKRLCDKHYQAWENNKKRQFKNNVNRIADAKIPKNIFINSEINIKKRSTRSEIMKKKVMREWTKYSRIRKSSVIHILNSREWRNTQELMSRKYVFCSGREFMSYISEVCYLYTLKLMYSREYLMPDNAYKKYVSFNRNYISDVIKLKLEVTWVFNRGDITSYHSKDIILIPSRIRRMVSSNKAYLKNKIIKLNKNSSDKKTMLRKSGGLYSRIKKENKPSEIKKFMSHMENNIMLKRHSIHYYPPFRHCLIEKKLPLFNLAKRQYLRVFGQTKNNIFIIIQKTHILPDIYLEFFALLSFYYITRGEGRVFIRDMIKLIQIQKKDSLVSFDGIIKDFNDYFYLAFKIRLEEKIKIAKLYNSCFSDDVIFYDDKSDELKSIKSRKLT